MGKVNKIIVDDTPCYWEILGPFKKPLKRNPPICAVCLKEIEYTEQMILILTNFKLFPNTCCHMKCAGIVDDSLIILLKSKYEIASEKLKEAKKLAKPWNI